MFLLPSMLGNLPESPFTLAPSSSRAGSQHRATSSLSQNILLRGSCILSNVQQYLHSCYQLQISQAGQDG